MLRRVVPACFILVSIAAFAFAQQKPNFSGTWKLNVAKSDFGVLPGPEARIDVISHTDPVVKVNSSSNGPQGKLDVSLTYSTDSKESVNKMGPREVKSTGAWEGAAIAINSKLNFNEQDVTIKAVWTLSADGQTLTQNVHLASAMGETDQKLIFEKQPEGATASLPEKAPAKTLPAPAASTGPHPNFSGVWKLNSAKSDFSVIPGPDSRVDTIEHAEPTVKLSRKETGPDGPREYVLNMSTDGKEIANSLGPNVEAKLTSNWEGNTLVTMMKLKLQEQDITIKRVSMLSEDGKTMTANSHIVSAMGELDQKEVYDKQ